MVLYFGGPERRPGKAQAHPIGAGAAPEQGPCAAPPLPDRSDDTSCICLAGSGLLGKPSIATHGAIKRAVKKSSPRGPPLTNPLLDTPSVGENILEPRPNPLGRPRHRVFVFSTPFCAICSKCRLNLRRERHCGRESAAHNANCTRSVGNPKIEDSAATGGPPNGSGLGSTTWSPKEGVTQKAFKRGFVKGGPLDDSLDGPLDDHICCRKVTNPFF